MWVVFLSFREGGGGLRELILNNLVRFFVGDEELALLLAGFKLGGVFERGFGEVLLDLAARLLPKVVVRAGALVGALCHAEQATFRPFIAIDRTAHIQEADLFRWAGELHTTCVATFTLHQPRFTQAADDLREVEVRDIGLDGEVFDQHWWAIGAAEAA